MPADSPNTAVNRTKPDRWKTDILQSVDMYNEWFMRFAPSAYRETRIKTTATVEDTLHKTCNLTDISAAVLTRERACCRLCTCRPVRRLPLTVWSALLACQRIWLGRWKRGGCHRV